MNELLDGLGLYLVLILSACLSVHDMRKRWDTECGWGTDHPSCDRGCDAGHSSIVAE